MNRSKSFLASLVILMLGGPASAGTFDFLAGLDRDQTFAWVLAVGSQDVTNETQYWGSELTKYAQQVGPHNEFVDALATANLHGGTLGALASANRGFDYAQATVGFHTSLTYHNRGGTEKDVRFHLDVSGYVSAEKDRGVGADGYGRLYAYTEFVNGYPYNPIDLMLPDKSSATIDFLVPAHETMTYDLYTGLMAYAGAWGTLAATADFSHTLHLTQELPDGVDFISDGVFLTQAVPEPSALATFSIGLVVLSLYRLAQRNRGRVGPV
jgi:hypothetical protein